MSEFPPLAGIAARLKTLLRNLSRGQVRGPTVRSSADADPEMQSESRRPREGFGVTALGGACA